MTAKKYNEMDDYYTTWNEIIVSSLLTVGLGDHAANFMVLLEVQNHLCLPHCDGHIYKEKIRLCKVQCLQYNTALPIHKKGYISVQLIRCLNIKYREWKS